MSSFENLRIVDNFYQTSLFFPMPTVLISTLCGLGQGKRCGIDHGRTHEDHQR